MFSSDLKVKHLFFKLMEQWHWLEDNLCIVHARLCLSELVCVSLCYHLFLSSFVEPWTSKLICVWGQIASCMSLQAWKRALQRSGLMKNELKFQICHIYSSFSQLSPTTHPQNTPSQPLSKLSTVPPNPYHKLSPCDTFSFFVCLLVCLFLSNIL